MNIIFQRFFNSKIIKMIKVFALKFVPRSFGDDSEISLIYVSQISSVFAFLPWEMLDFGKTDGIDNFC